MRLPMTYDFCMFLFVGVRRVMTRTSGYRSHMSMLHICNAVGISLPPLYVFTGKKARHEMLDGAPEGKNVHWKKYHFHALMPCHAIPC